MRLPPKLSGVAGTKKINVRHKKSRHERFRPKIALLCELEIRYASVR